jgi:quercetin dioxygenase-like cupin family protein
MYESSWTWFDTEVIKAAHTKSMYANGTEQEILGNERGQEKVHYAPDDDLLLPRNNKLKVNGSRVSELQNSVITWHYQDDIQPESAEAYEIERSQGRGRLTLDGRGVRELEVGDSIALWARARFPGWRNHVDFASVRIFWAV